MKLPLAALVLVTFGLTAAAVLQEEPYSGPLPGEPLVPFDAVGMNGELRDEVHDYVAAYAGATTVYCFIHEVSRASGRTLRALDDACLARRDEGLEALFVLLGKDQDETERYGLELPGLLDIRSPLAVALEGEEGPGAWGLNRAMTLTVVVAKGDVAVANFALLTTNETDVPKIMAAADEALHAVASFEDVQRELAALRERVRALEAQVAAAPPAGRTGRAAMRDAAMPGMEAAADPEAALLDLVRRAVDSAAQPVRAGAVVAEIQAALEADPTLVPRFMQALEQIELNEAGTPLLRRQLRGVGTAVGASALGGGGR